MPANAALLSDAITGQTSSIRQMTWIIWQCVGADKPRQKLTLPLKEGLVRSYSAESVPEHGAPSPDADVRGAPKTWSSDSSEE
jgi:hypothetical protein